MKCDMTDDCNKPIQYIDSKGFIYCISHGVQRKSYVNCRKLTPKELKTLQDGKPLKKY